MKDLIIEYRDFKNGFVRKEYDTIMDFLNEMDSEDNRKSIKNDSYIHYKLFENVHNQGFAENVNKLCFILEQKLK